MSDTKIESTCPYCGRVNQVHSGANVDGGPDEGSVSLCWGCQEPSLFTADLSLCKPTDEERAEIMEDPAVQRMLYSMRESTRPQEAKTMFDHMSANARPE